MKLVFAWTLAMQGQRLGEIRIEAKDPAGSAMQAAGTLRSLGGGSRRNFTTDAGGGFRFEGLLAGEYEIALSKRGFSTQTARIELEAGALVTKTFIMRLSAQSAEVSVVSTTPLAGTSLAADQVAAPIQTASAADIESSGALDLGDFLNRHLNGVSLNDMQANPFQMDVNFRGYTASPLLGTPEGISVYLDGVRQNQPFGDVVSWDLIPKNAIAEVTLIPGSNPVFGLNTLGGALSIQTKNGVSNPGWAGALTYGASGRKAAQAEYGGGGATGFNWFLAGTGFHESGWRVDSPSDVRQGFARLGWRTDKTDLALTMTYAYNTLFGNGPQDYRLLERSYQSVYSIPDSTADRSPSFNLTARHTFTSALNFAGNAWFRNIRTEGINANLNTDSFDQSVYQPSSKELAALTAAGYTGFPASGANATNTPFPKWRCIADALLQSGADQRCDAATIYSKSVENDYGVSGQLTWNIAGNQLTVGGAVDRGVTNFTQNTAYGYLNSNYSVTNVAAWQLSSAVNLHGSTPNGGLFFTDTWTIAKTLNLSVSGRFNRFTISNTDRVNPVAGPGSLDGNYTFERFNPGVGLTWSPAATVNLYGSFTQGSRAPSSIELGCADPANPCSLPNALASDPPLQEVATNTWEFGARGKPELSFAHGLSWNAGAFRAENRNDILFVSSPQLGTGYFQNFAKTRRQGLDADVSGRIGRATWGLDYTYLICTYESAAILDGSSNNTSDSALSGYPGLDGNIYIHPGDRIPLIPKQNGKAYLNYPVTSKLGLDFIETAVSSSYARGNENNAYRTDGKYYLGPGVSPGYAATNFRAHYKLAAHTQLAVQMDNVFDRRYYTAAQLANTGLSAQGAFLARPFPAYVGGPQAGNYPLQSATFFSPGAPRRAWVELRVKF